MLNEMGITIHKDEKINQHKHQRIGHDIYH